MKPIHAVALFALALSACNKQGSTSGAGNGTAAAPTGPIAAVPPPAGKQWSEVAAFTPEGGVKMGNPDAPVAFVEYASLYCPHCGEFAKEAADPLVAKYVSTGKVSWEYRPFLLQPLDVPPFLLTRCRGPEPFFKLAEQVYADQKNWEARFFNMTPDQQQALMSQPPAQLPAAIAKQTGLDAFFRVRGMSAQQVNQCLADTKAAQALADNTQKAAQEQNITGTPTFFINGKMEENLHTWDQVDARLAELTR